MRVTPELVQKLGLPEDYQDGNLVVFYEKRGGQIVCPQCKTVLNTPNSFKNGIVDFEGQVPTFCPTCNIKGVLKGATRTNTAYARLTHPHGHSHLVMAKRSPKETPNREVVEKVLFGRLSKAVRLHLPFYYGRTRAERKKAEEEAKGI